MDKKKVFITVLCMAILCSLDRVKGEIMDEFTSCENGQCEYLSDAPYFSEFAKVTTEKGLIKVSYKDYSFDIEPTITIAGADYDKSYFDTANIKYEIPIVNLKNKYKFSLNVSSIPLAVKNNLDSIGFKITNIKGFEEKDIVIDNKAIVIKNLRIDFSDLTDLNYSVDVTNDRISIGSVKGLDSLWLDPVVEPEYEMGSGTDDAFENRYNGMVNTTLTYLYGGNYDSDEGSYFMGLRFVNIEIPQGSIINDAKIQMVADANFGVGNVTSYIVAENVDNSVTFAQTTNNISARAMTGNKTLWYFTSLTQGSAYNTTNFSTSVKQVVDRASWASGNALTVIVLGNYTATYNRPKWASSESASYADPVLYIAYTTANTAPQFSSIKEPTDPSIYTGSNYQFNVTIIDGDGLSLNYIEFNDTDATLTNLKNFTLTSGTGFEYYKTFTNLGSGKYFYKFYSNDSLGLWNSTSQYDFTISKGASLCNLYLNGTEANTNYANNTGLNVTVKVNNSQGTNALHIASNFTGWVTQNGNAPLLSNTSIKLNVVGVWNFTGYYDATTNYTSCTPITWYATVPAGNSPQWSNNITNPLSPQNYPLASIQFNVSCSDTDGECIGANLTFNGVTTQMSNNSGVYYTTKTGLGVGTYPYYFTLYDNQSLTNTTPTWNYIINKGTQTVSLAYSNVTFPNVVSFSCSGLESTTPTLSLNNSIQNISYAFLGVGNYNLSCSLTETANYSSTSSNAWLTVLPNGTWSDTGVSGGLTVEEHDTLYGVATNTTTIISRIAEVNTTTNTILSYVTSINTTLSTKEDIALEVLWYLCAFGDDDIC